VAISDRQWPSAYSMVNGCLSTPQRMPVSENARSAPIVELTIWPRT